MGIDLAHMTITVMQQCCICGRPLPNRYAVAGKCQDDGCDAVFCALHWNNGNRHCGNHGWKPSGILDKGVESVVSDTKEAPACEIIPGEVTEVEMNDNLQGRPDESVIRAEAQKKLTAEHAKGILRSVAEFAGKFGAAASALVMKIKNEKSPEGLLNSIDAQLEANRNQRAPLMERADKLFAEISAKKKVYQSAPTVKKRLLELELKTLLSEYKGIERQLTAFFDNENTLNTVRGRVLELMAVGMRKIDEKTIDKLTDDIEDAIGEAEDVAGAVRDLDKAGKRHENESDQDAFESALAGFDDDSISTSTEETETPFAASSDPFPVDPPVRTATAPSATPEVEEP